MMTHFNCTGGRLARISVLGLSVAFAIRLVTPSRSDPVSPAETLENQKNQVRAVPERTATLSPRASSLASWAELESADYTVFAANLRRFGCPEQTIRDLVFMDLLANAERSDAFEGASSVAESFASIFGLSIAEGLPAGFSTATAPVIPMPEESSGPTYSLETPDGNPPDGGMAGEISTGGDVPASEPVPARRWFEAREMDEMVEMADAEGDLSSDDAFVSAAETERASESDDRVLNPRVRELLAHLLRLAQADDPAQTAKEFKEAELASLRATNSRATETELQNQYDLLLDEAKTWLRAE